ncbi:MAG: helicase-related protein [Bacteroidota bacterium]
MVSLRDHDFRPSYGASDDRLHGFYIPALSASVRYDRSAGFFSSHTLGIAAAGLARLIARDGRMRLLVGAQLSEEDVQAIEAGASLDERVSEAMSSRLDEDAEGALRDRLAALAWMVAEGTLEVKVVLPKGPNGLPLSGAVAREYYHPKTGIFTDEAGNRLAFSGSSNESVSGWIKNYEEFFVFTSWGGGDVWIGEAQRRFDRLWTGTEPDWIAMEVPEAARKKLLRYTPDRPPSRDPHERGEDELPQPEDTEQSTLTDRAVAQYLLDAPRLLGASGLGAATSGVEPWPHQAYIAQRVVETFPRRYLVADEVGLGKTISAGLAIRQLVLSGRARRVLILTPKSVLRQWQEELFEKFVMNVPVYDGQSWVDIYGEVTPVGTGNPWDAVEVGLASSHLVKRRERQPEVLAAQPWDLVVVDEAHHARRKDFQDATAYRPNRLLELLIGLEAKTRGMLLLTATPMQVHPIEVWDLLHLLGLSGTWAADGQEYLRFFTELRQGLSAADVEYVFGLVREETEVDGLDPHFERTVSQELGPVEWQRVRGLLTDRAPARTIALLSEAGREAALALARHHTPLRRLVIRNTRDLLRRYIARGLLDASVPHRDAQPVWVGMTEAEAALYDRIEEYITHFYRTYEAERKGLGFVMTVYRRRLTSSFYAVRKSLERRLNFLRGLQAQEAANQLSAFDDDDLEELTLEFDLDEAVEDADPGLFQAEIRYVEDFLSDLTLQGSVDSKVERLLRYLHDVFRQRDTVIVFTQYTDTMDFLREELKAVYGSQVGCYSGRGGERWDGVAWVEETKAEMKRAFREGEAIKILLCTEAASEGLNLQTCGVLVNYDMPWNPMRVEQRIGRVDRIGQRYPEVWVRNYFYEGTVEARVYRALEDRIDWFENVVGRLQPILGRVGRLIQQAALTPEAEREATLQEGLNEVKDALEEAQAGFDLDTWASEAEEDRATGTPVTLADLERELAQDLPSATRFRLHPTVPKAFVVEYGGDDHTVTFDRAVADAHPSTVELLTYGHPLLPVLLREPHERVEGLVPPYARLAEAALGAVGWYEVERGEPVHMVQRLREEPPAGEEPGGDVPEAIAAVFQEALQAERERRSKHEAYQSAARESAWTAAARAIVEEATLLDLAQHYASALFADGPPPVFDQSAAQRLRRHGYPFAGLLVKTPTDGLDIRPMHPRYLELKDWNVAQLAAAFSRLKERAKRHLAALP